MRGPHSQFEKARQAYKAHDFAQAKSLLKQVLQAEPQLADAYLLLGLAEVESGETNEAIAHYQQALKLQPKSFARPLLSCLGVFARKESGAWAARTRAGRGA